MNILRKLLPGLLPLLVFIVVDEVWGTKAGLIAALAFGISELAYYYIRERRIDRFILLDTGLLIILGTVSLLLENDIFFKIKPAFIELILLGIIGYSIWGKTNLVLKMSQRYTGEMQMSGDANRLMRRNMLAMFWITGIHILLVLWSAWYASDKVWAFISGVLFYLMFGAWFGVIWITGMIRKKNRGSEELFPIVDEEGNVTGTAPRSVCHDGKSKLLHPVVHLHLFDSKGKLYLQKRSAAKDIQPGKWDTSVGGHIAPGESIEQALKREAAEELGISGFEPRFAHRYVWESSRERELVFTFITVSDSVPVVNPEEIDEGRYWTVDEISSAAGKDIFTPNFEKEFSLLREKFGR